MCPLIILNRLILHSIPTNVRNLILQQFEKQKNSIHDIFFSKNSRTNKPDFENCMGNSTCTNYKKNFFFKFSIIKSQFSSWKYKWSVNYKLCRWNSVLFRYTYLLHFSWVVSVCWKQATKVRYAVSYIHLARHKLVAMEILFLVYFCTLSRLS